MKNKKRILAAILSVVMTITMLPSTVYATDSVGEEAAEPVVEAAVIPGEEQEIETTAESIVDEDEAVTEDVTLAEDEAPAEENTDTVPEEDSEEEPAEETAENPAEEETAETPVSEEDLYPAQDLKAETANVTVTVKAPQGALPAGTELRVEEVGKEEYRDLVDEATSYETADFIAVDVSFYVSGSDEKIEPREEVEVGFSLEKDALPEAETYDVIHVAVDEEEGTETPEIIEEEKIIDEITAEGGTISQKDFSVFIIAAGGTSSTSDTDDQKAVETYIFYFYDAEEGWVANDELTQAVKKGDTLYEPAVPEGINYIFKGWYEYDPETGNETPFDGFGTISSVASSRAEHHIRAVVEEAFYVIFHDSNGEASIIKTVKAADGDTVSTEGVEAQSVSNQQIFDGWTTEQGGTVKVNSVTLPAETETGNVDLYPVFVNGYVLSFDANDGNTGTASSTPTQYLKETDPYAKKPDDPIRDGYTFDSWYLDSAGNTPFDFASPLTGDLTVYAKWSPAETTYRVLIWKQKVTDDKQLNISNNHAGKTYEFDRSFGPYTAVTGSTVNAALEHTRLASTDPNESQYYDESFKGFVYNSTNTDKNVTVQGDGTTVINVYYDRRVITYRFYRRNPNPLDFLRPWIRVTEFYKRARGTEVPTHYFSIIPPFYFEKGEGPRAWWPDDWDLRLRYVKVTASEMTGLYGQSLTGNGYEWPNGKWLYGDQWNNTLTFTNTFQIWNEDGTTMTEFHYQNDNPDFVIVNYVETSDGVYEAYNAVNGYRGLFWQDTDFTFEEKYTGFTPAAYLLTTEDDIVDDYQGLPAGAVTDGVGVDSDVEIPRGNNLLIFHARKTHTIEFKYVDGTGIDTASEKYEAPLDAYATRTAEHPTDSEHYIFTGWFRNKELDDQINFTGMKMPDGNIVAYAGFKKVTYNVTIDPAGGTFADDGTNAARSLIVKYDEKVAEPVVSREDYILTGWTATFANGEQGPWTFNSDTVKEDLAITAGWYYTKDIKLQYYNGTDIVERRSYRDGAEATLIHPDEIDGFEAPDPDNQFFKGWEIDGTLYSSGAMYTVSASNMDADGAVKAYAVYGDLLEQEETSIVLKTTKAGTSITDGNRTAAAGEAGITLGLEGVNKDEFDLSAISGSHAESQYELVGWSKEDGGNVVFKTTDKVAADNKNLTDGENVLYAVWQAKFGIYHSSDGEVEVLSIPDEPVDLAAKVRDNYMYGGYYSYVEEAEDGDKHPHRGDAITDVPGTRLNPDKDEYTVYYLREVSTNYLKPQVFAVWYRYSIQKLTQIHLLTNLDETEYIDFGVAVGSSEDELVDQSGSPTYHDKLNLIQRNSDGTQNDPDVYTPERLFGTSGYFAAYNGKELLTEDNTFTMIGYYVTKDEVRVTGGTRWTISLGDLDKTNVRRTFAEPGWSYDKPQDSVVPVTPEEPDAVPAGRFMVAPYRVVQEPGTFNITKVDNGAEYVQKVSPGDNTGALTYEGKAGYVFAGWYADASFTEAADLSDVQDNMTVYAKYEQESRVKLTFSKKSVKNGSVTLKTTLKITDMEDIEDVSVVCSTDSQYEASFGSPAVSKSGTLVTETYTGTVVIPGLKSGNTFTAVISYTTPDGTNVVLGEKNCKYSMSIVTVK